MFKSDKSKAVAAMFMVFMQCVLLTYVICIKPQYELYICALVCQVLCFLPVAYYQVKYQHQFPDLLMCLCVCSITVREMVGLWRPELSEIASKIQCVIAFVYFISAFRKAFCRTNELQSMVDDMKHQNSVKDSGSPADAGEGEKVRPYEAIITLRTADKIGEDSVALLKKAGQETVKEYADILTHTDEETLARLKEAGVTETALK